MRHQARPRWLLAVVLAMASGCGTKSKIEPGFEKSAPTVYAFLPADYPSGIARERVDYIHTVVGSELRNNGFVLLDSDLVRHSCSTPKCPERKTLSEKNGVDGFLDLELDSVERFNFLAGYYNTITGTLRVTSPDEKELVRIDHTERDKGGLIFNSGQVFQGIISQVRNSGDDSFNNLAERFARSVVSHIPPPPSGTADSGAQGGASLAGDLSSEISDVDLKKVRPSVYNICASASPDSMAFVVFGRTRANLREVSSGKFCGNFQLGAGAAPSTLTIEARSPFGLTARKVVETGVVPVCSLEGAVTLESEKAAKKVVIHCARGDRGDKLHCGKEDGECSAERFVIYRAKSLEGPFQKVATIQSNVWQDKMSSGDDFVYQVISVGKDNQQSLPVLAKSSES